MFDEFELDEFGEKKYMTSEEFAERMYDWGWEEAKADNPEELAAFFTKRLSYLHKIEGTKFSLVTGLDEPATFYYFDEIGNDEVENVRRRELISTIQEWAREEGK